MVDYSLRLDKALRIAAWAHEQQQQHRKGTDIPYIIHPVGVMLIAASVTKDEDTLIACLLHDVLEDVAPKIYSEADMRRDFGDNATSIVKHVSKDDSISGWRERSQAYLDHIDQEASPGALIVCAADKIHNLVSMIADYQVEGDKLWEKFTTNSAEDQLWWYESVLNVLRRRMSESPLTGQLKEKLLQLKALMPA